MTRILPVAALFIIIICDTVCAGSDTLWTKTYGGSGDEYGSCVQQTADKGFIITGTTSSYGAGDADVWLIKTDASGDTLWTRTFGGSQYDHGIYVQLTSDSGYIITGLTSSYGSGEQVWLIRTDAAGDTLWTKTFGGSGDEYGSCVQQTSDGGFIITGSTSSYGAGDRDVWLIRTDAAGNSQWSKTFGGSNYDDGKYVQQSSDGGYIITGLTASYGAGNWDVWLIKTDEYGNSSWKKTFGGSANEMANSVQQTSDDGYILTGKTESYGSGMSDVWLIRTNVSGDTLWTKTFGGSYQDVGLSAQQTTDAGYIISGWTDSFAASGPSHADVWIIRTDNKGDTLWTRILGGIYEEGGYSVRETSDGGYIITGSTYSYGAGYWDIWLIRMAPDHNPLAIENGANPTPGSFALCQNYPNPFNPSTIISFDLSRSQFAQLYIYDITGRILVRLVNGIFNAGHHNIVFNGSGLPSGIYFYYLRTNLFSDTKKMIILR